MKIKNTASKRTESDSIKLKEQMIKIEDTEYMREIQLKRK